MDRRLGALALAVAVALAFPALAEDVEKKWRLSVAVGGYNPLDEAPSNTANVFTVIDRAKYNAGRRERVDLYRDPRDDNAAFSNLDMSAGVLGTLAVQYALTKTFLLEGSIGYQTADMNNVQVSAEFAADPPPIEEVSFNFRSFNFLAGEITRIPIQLNGIFRFRPRAKFNPYVGVGIGYALIGFEPSSSIDELSFNIDSQIGTECQLSSSFNVLASMPCGGPTRGMRGIEIEAGDSFEYNVALGGEVTVKRKMAVIIDFRYVGASREMSVKVDNGLALGNSVPQLVDFDDSPAAIAGVNGVYGALLIGTPNDVDVGLIDAGYRKLVPSQNDPGADCGFPNPASTCVPQFFASPGSGQLLQNFKGEIYRDTNPGEGDGRRDPGRYYVQGGSFSWSGLSLQVGFRYTF